MNTKTTKSNYSLTAAVDKCANFACLLDLLAAHPDIQQNNTLMGSVAALKSSFVDLWNEIEDEAEKLLEPEQA
jgi:hypothetical protein